jgi:hypothetical protein
MILEKDLSEELQNTMTGQSVENYDEIIMKLCE